MPNATVLRVGGVDYNIKDAAALDANSLNSASIIETFYQGGFVNAGAGNPVSSIELNSNTNRIRSINNNSGYSDAFPVSANTKIRISVDNGYKYAFQAYKSSNRVGQIALGFSTQPASVTFTEDYAIIVMIGKVDDSDIATSEAGHCHIEVWNDVKEDIAIIEDNLNSTPFPVSFQQGGFISAGQGNAYTSLGFNDNTNRIRNIPESTNIKNAMFVKAGTSLHLSVDPGYKYAYQVYSAISGKALDTFAVGSAPKTVTKDEDTYLIVWVGKNGDADILPAEGSHFHLNAWNSALSAADKVSEKVAELISETNVIFENRFIPTSLLSLPSGFDDFPIPIQISRLGSVYGYFLDVGSFYKRTSNNATYYVSLTGNDANDGLTPETALLTLTAAIAKTDVGTIVVMPGTYLNGVHFNSTAITKPLNIIGVGNVVFDTPYTASPLNIRESCYIKNITFRHGTSNLTTVLEQELCVFDHCNFEGSETGSALTAQGGYYIMYYCHVDNAYGDGFNYHTYDSTYPCQVVEICCTGRDCGNNSDSLTSNCSTIHEADARIIRIGCEYSTSKGCVVADADTALSVNIAVVASCSIGLDSDTRDGNFGSLSGAEMWLYDCVSFGSPKDIISDASTIHSTKTYTTESAINSGVIDHIQ